MATEHLLEGKTFRVFNKTVDAIPHDAVYIGRPSKWGNPFVIGVGGRTRQDCLRLYKAWLWHNRQLLWEAGSELAEKDLVCHCAPLPCHGDILRQAIRWLTYLPARDYDSYFPDRPSF